MPDQEVAEAIRVLRRHGYRNLGIDFLIEAQKEINLEISAIRRSCQHNFIFDMYDFFSIQFHCLLCYEVCHQDWQIFSRSNKAAYDKLEKLLKRKHGCSCDNGGCREDDVIEKQGLPGGWSLYEFEISEADLEEINGLLNGQ